MALRSSVKEFVFKHNMSFASCHASTIATLNNSGDVIVAWFGGTKEGAGDCRVWCARRITGLWQEPFLVAGPDEEPHWNPVLFQSGGTGRLHLYYKVGKEIATWRTMTTMSDDDGLTWSQPAELVPGDIGGRGPVKNKVVVLQSGVWLAPGSVEGERWDSFVDRSHDQGVSWQRSHFIPVRHRTTEIGERHKDIPVVPTSFQGKGIIQPTIWESEQGVHMLLRSSDGWVYRSDSLDDGCTWCPAYRTSLPSNNSGLDLAQLHNGFLVLVYNPVGVNWGPRTPLVVTISKDNGHSWSEALRLEDGQGEFSYPSVITAESKIYIVYTWRRQRIVFCACDYKS